MTVSISKALSALLGGGLFSFISGAFLALYMPFMDSPNDRMLISAILIILFWVMYATVFVLKNKLWQSWVYLSFPHAILLASIVYHILNKAG